MAEPKHRWTIVKLPKCPALIEVASAAINRVSIKQQRLVTARIAAVAGFDQILDDDRIKIAILLKLYDKMTFKADGEIHVGFIPEELRLLHECRKTLEALRLEKLNRQQTIILGLLRHARRELD